jgi:ABC-type branched-subunit amino acid transport system permease subunit
MVLLGGAGTLYGPIVAALVLTFVSEALVSLGIWRFLIISAGMVLVLVLFPGGFASVARHLLMLRHRNTAPPETPKRQAV